MLRSEARLHGSLSDFRRLRAFIVVAEELHYGRASKRLMMTQSPLSRIISGLEADLGIALFVRNRKTVRLTRCGELFLDDARDIVQLADESSRKMLKLSEAFNVSSSGY